VLQEIRNRQYFEKPSEKRKKAKALAVKRWKKRMREEFWDYYIDGLPKEKVANIIREQDRNNKKKLKRGS